MASEKQLIQRLNSDVLKTAERLYRAAWIAKQQRINLDRLILTRSDLLSRFTLLLENKRKVPNVLYFYLYTDSNVKITIYLGES